MFASTCAIDERLPRNIIPTHYKIKIIPDFEDFKTNGTVRLTLHVKEETNHIIFNINDIEIDANTLKITTSQDSRLIAIKNQEYLESYGYKITLNEVLKQEEIVYLDIVYSGQLNPHLQGFYKISYVDDLGSLKTAASTQFSPTDARRAFPCFDEPYFKAQFTISIARPSDMSTLSNMPLEKSEPLIGSKNWLWDHYPATPKMSTYIVGFMVINLKTNSNLDNLIRVWCRKELLPQSEYASKMAPKILNYLENYFTIKYPLTKMDLVAVPEFGFSAMENWGLITFRESVLLYNSGFSSLDNKKRTALVMGHEIAHQWFGNLVTPMTWNDLWLKEGFATYFEYLSVDHSEPSWQIMDEFMIDETARALKEDALESVRPISANLINCQQIRETFDAISYAKGAALVRMMHHFMGDDAFQSGLISVLKKYEYGNIDCEDLFNCLNESAHRHGVLKSTITVNEIMKNWTKQPGFPVLTIKLDDNGDLILSQKRFLISGTKDYDTKWWIPVSVITDSSKDFHNTKPFAWVEGEETMKLQINFEEWYLLNAYQTGYYVVNYDETNWRSLIKNISLFPLAIRAQLIGDSMDLAKAGLLNYDIPLSLIQSISQQSLYMGVCKMIGNNKLGHLKNLLSNTSIGSYIKEFPQANSKKPVKITNPECEKCCRCTTCKFFRDNLSELVNQNSSIRVQDAGGVFSSLAKEKPTMAFDFLRKHWFKFQERYGDGFGILARMVTTLTSYMNNEEQLNELIEFQATMKDNLSTTKQAFDTAIETVRANVEWMQKNYEYVEKWLLENKDLNVDN